MNRISRRIHSKYICFLAAVLALTVPACSTTHYRESADKEPYGILNEKSPAVVNADPDFTIDRPELSSLEGLDKETEPNESLDDAANEEVGAYIVSLEKAMELAVKHSRNYQNQKESLYVAALRLTGDRYEYAPIFSAGASGDFSDFTRDKVVSGGSTTVAAKTSASVANDMDELAGTPGALIQSYQVMAKDAMAAKNAAGETVDIVDEQTIDGRVSLGVNKLLKGGGRIAVSLTTDFFRYITGDPRVSTSSALVAEFTQPLLRGRGAKVSAERLTQAERDVLYALRTFARFRKVFAVDIARSYYGVLRNRDTAQNNYKSFQAFQESLERDQAMFDEGRKAMADLGRTQQASLRAENTWTNSARRYLRSLDNFKIQLGLPVDINLVLDEGELDQLKEQGIREWTISQDDATLVALHSRLDLYNSRDRLEDTARKVEVQANEFLPDLNLVVGGVLNSKPGDRFQDPDFRRASWGAGLDFDLPLDRKAERNAYRTALINLDLADRQLELAVDNVKLEVRDSLRNLQEEKQTYEINLLGVEINENRVEEAKLLAELGRGRSQDLVDAQNDLTTALNDLTGALINHTIARLEFWRDMGILLIKEDGQWEEVTDKFELPEPESETIQVTQNL